MNYETFGKDFYISINKSKNLVVICKNPNAHLLTLEDMEDTRKRYLYEKGQSILTPFGIQIIKEIIYDYNTKHGYEWLIMVEENGNQYKPMELIGIVEKTMTIKEFNNLLNFDVDINLEDIMTARLYCLLRRGNDFLYMSDIHKYIQDNGLECFWKFRNFGKKSMEELQNLLIKYPYVNRINLTDL